MAAVLTVEKEYVSHTNIGMEIEAIVHGTGLFDPGRHNRENLDDLISDLVQYRDTLPTADEYMAKGML
mgnify:FL=1|tara:strand:- start:24 stop:227 length:204 start_codon:yes stop_codon:yes gene_type:complete